MEKITCVHCKKELEKGDEYIKYDDGVKCKEFHVKPCDVYSRVVGFHTPINRWNKGKEAEWKDRKTFKVEEGIK